MSRLSCPFWRDNRFGGLMPCVMRLNLMVRVITKASLDQIQFSQMDRDVGPCVSRVHSSAPAHADGPTRRWHQKDDLPAIELERFTTLEEVSEVWPAIAERSGNLFASWEWISTWWRHFGRGRELAGTIARRSDGKPAVIVPLYMFGRKPLTILRFLGHGSGDWLGPIYAPGEEELAVTVLQATIAGAPHWDVFLAEHMRSDQRPTQALAGTVVRSEGFPILPFRKRSWDQLLEERSSNFRQQVRRRERRLARTRRLNYRLSTDPQRLDADLDVLFNLHRARWSRGNSSAFAGAREAFHREFARLALARGWLRLWIMELDDEPAAVWYGFRYGGVEWYYQAGRDPSYDSASVGFVLLCHTIRAALEDGAKGYWLLRGGETYKHRFAEEDPGVQTLAVARSLRGRAAITAAGAVDLLPAPGRRWARAHLG
jgi:CelD/BcsL family acetyltransferase involved in cellulose biosynthesis